MAGPEAIEVKVTVINRQEALALRKFGLKRTSFSIGQKPPEIGEVACGDRPIAKLFSGEQEDFLREMAPSRLQTKTRAALEYFAARR